MLLTILSSSFVKLASSPVKETERCYRKYCIVFATALNRKLLPTFLFHNTITEDFFYKLQIWYWLSVIFLSLKLSNHFTLRKNRSMFHYKYYSFCLLVTTFTFQYFQRSQINFRIENNSLLRYLLKTLILVS